MEKKILELLAEVLDIDTELKADSKLKDFATWDSLAVVALMARVYSDHGIQVTAQEINNVATAGELIELFNSK